MPEPRLHGPQWAGHRQWRGGGGPMLRRMFVLLIAMISIGFLIGIGVAAAIGLISGPFRWLIGGIAVLVIVTGFLGVRRLFARSLTPVGELIDAIQRVGEGESGVRVPIRRPGPFAAVTNSFNRMAASLEEEDERRRRLLADLSHELRTPLTVIRGEIEAVVDGLHDSSGLTNVIDEVELMERLLEDLRVLALTEAGRLRLQLETTDVVSLIDEVISSFSTTTEIQGVVVSFDPGVGHHEITVDPHRLHQVLSNLTSNALKQMPDGGRLTITVTADEAKTVIEVSDTGPGIPEDRLEVIFDRFVKAIDSKGTGLGLSIARDLVLAHRGTITAASPPEGGAVFTITLPQRPV